MFSNRPGKLIQTVSPIPMSELTVTLPGNVRMKRERFNFDFFRRTLAAFLYRASFGLDTRAMFGCTRSITVNVVVAGRKSN